MAQKDSKAGTSPEELRRLALAYSGAEEDSSCSHNSYKIGRKSFLFLGSWSGGYDAMLRLGPSRDEAIALAASDPRHYKIGYYGWVTVKFAHDETPPVGLLDRWIDESYRLVTDKSLGASSPAAAEPKAAEPKAAEPKAAEPPAAEDFGEVPTKRTKRRPSTASRRPRKKRASRKKATVRST